MNQPVSLETQIIRIVLALSTACILASMNMLCA